MNSSDWSTLAEIVSAVAVVISLIYLAIQVHRNTRQMQSQGVETVRKEFLSNFDATTKTPSDARLFRDGLNRFDQLDPNDQACFSCSSRDLI